MAQNQNQGRGGDQGDNRGGNQGNQGGTSNRGFASMDDDKQRDIASQGGREAHRRGTAHEFDSEEARMAGQKGGQMSGNRGSDADANRDLSTQSDEMRAGTRSGDQGNRGGSGSSGGQGSQGGSSDRGFGSMDENEQKEISRKGGESSGGGNR